mmetsp:Transcript_3209/g.19888  ORF Transcript_3209/g.19888 Transcript_3209/m.19888 type:complete len:317 (+) Transcript_3209:3378-4328(+)
MYPSTCVWTVFFPLWCVAHPLRLRLLVPSTFQRVLLRTHLGFVVRVACIFLSLHPFSFRFRHLQQPRDLLFGLHVSFRTCITRTFQRIDGIVHASLCQPRCALSKVSIGLFRPCHVHVHVPFAGLLHPRRTCLVSFRHHGTSFRLPTLHVSFCSNHRRFCVFVLDVPRFHENHRSPNVWNARARRTSKIDGAWCDVCERTRVAKQGTCTTWRRRRGACDARGDVGAVLESQRCDGCQAAKTARGVVVGTRRTWSTCDERKDGCIQRHRRRGRVAWCEDPSAIPHACRCRARVGTLAASTRAPRRTQSNRRGVDGGA